MVQFNSFQRRIPAPLFIGGAFIVIFVVALIIFQLSESLIVSAAFLIVSSIAAYLFIQRFEEKTAPVKTQASASQADLSRTEHKLNVVSKRMTALETRMTSMEASSDNIGDAVSNSILEELETVGHALRDIADIIVEHHRILVEVDQIGDTEKRSMAPGAMKLSDGDQPPSPSARAENAKADDETVVSMSKRQMETLLRQEMLSGRIGAYSQGIISLPSKKKAFNTLSFCIENSQGDAILERDLVQMGVSRNLLLLFDRVRFGYTHEIARHGSNNTLPLICPMSIITLLEPSATSEMIATLRRNPGLAGKIIFLFSEYTLENCGDIGRENMARLHKAGITFALEIANDLMIDVVTLANMGFRAVLIPFRLLRDAESGQVRTEIHPSDLPGLMDRYNMEIVATGLSDAAELSRLRKFNVYLAHGPLFDTPRLVRFTALQEQMPVDSSGPQSLSDNDALNSDVVHRVVKTREQLKPTPLRDHLPKVGS
ncbi:MAG: EAL domain-containing protein [Hyphomicrobiales bacterium]